MLRVPLPLFALIAVVGLAAATHTPTGRCDADGWPALGIIELPGPLAGVHDGIYYLDDRNYLLGNGIWVYEEANGIYTRGGDAPHNLQRGSESGLPDTGEICVDDPLVRPDWLISR